MGKKRTISVYIDETDYKWLKKHPSLNASGIFREKLRELKQKLPDCD